MHLRTSRIAWVFGGLLLAALAACEKSAPPAPDTAPSFDAWSVLDSEGYGAGDLTLKLNTASVTVGNAGEGGVTFRLLEPGPGMSAIFYSYRGQEPANVRTASADGSFNYSSTAVSTHVLLGPEETSAALIYSGAGAAFEVTISGVEPCGDRLLCNSDGTVAWRLPVAPRASQLLASPYGAAELRLTDAMSLAATSSETGEFGIQLRPEVEPEGWSLLVFDPTEPDRSYVVTGAGSQKYGATSDGWLLLAPKESALIYAAGPGQINLSGAELSNCEDTDWRCALDRDLAKDLPDASSGISGALQVTEWGSREADFGFSTTVSAVVKPGMLSAAQMHGKYFEDDIAGGYCGATAVFLARLLRAQGYDAFSFDFGIPGSNLTHVTTILALDGKFYLMDATFGGYFAKSGTKVPLDILSILAGDEFDLVEFDADDRNFIVDEASHKEGIDPRLKNFKDCAVHPETQYRVCKNPSFGMDQYLSAFSANLKSAGLPVGKATLVELLKRGVTGMGDAEDTDSMREFAQALDALGIPFHDLQGGPAPSRLLKSDQLP